MADLQAEIGLCSQKTSPGDLPSEWVTQNPTYKAEDRPSSESNM